MSEIEFNRLVHATGVRNSKTLFFDQVREWEVKRKTLLVQLSDFPTLIEAHISRDTEPYQENPNIQLVDTIPTIRLSNACEATANGLYSLAEISANFANKASQGAIPSSFNAIRKKCELDPDSELAKALGDLQWYKKIRELRTEWAHYSSIFIGQDTDKQPLLCIRSYRRSSDKEEFPGPNFSCSITQLINWTNNTITTIDAFGGFLLYRYVLALHEPDTSVINAVRDRNGFPIISKDGRFKTENITVRQYLARAGIVLPA